MKKLLFALVLSAAVLSQASDRVVVSGGDIASAVTTVINEGGGVVWLEEGSYSLAAQTALLDIPDGVSIQAQGARDKTVIDLANGYGYALKGATAKIKGVTFTSSVTLTDSTDLTLPRFVNVVTGLLENCTFRDFTIGGTKYKGSHPVRLYVDGTVSGCLFTNITCTAQYMSDGQDGTIVVIGGTITNTCFRSCNTYPAPIMAYPRASARIEDCEFTGIRSSNGNSQAQYGAVYARRNGQTLTATLKRCLVTDNQCTGSGVAYVYDAGNNSCNLAFQDCVLTNNVGKGYGGVYRVGNKGYCTFDRCIIAGNTGATSGVGTLSTWYTMVFRNCLIAGNIGKSTAGVLYSSGSYDYYQIENCTIAGNRTESGAVQGLSVASANNTCRIYNCIVYGNGAAAGDQQLTAPEAKVFSSCYPEATSGNANGNISSDPLYKNAAAGDYRLNYASPCLDVAVDRSATCGTLDLVGTTRPQCAKGVSEAWDMGCYEMPPNTEPMSVLVTLGAKAAVAPARASATAAVTGAGLSGLVYDWTVTRTTPSGATATEYKGFVTNELVVSDLGPGSYAFAVKVTNAQAETAEATCTDTLSVRPAVCYVKRNALGVWPYDTWEKATSNLLSAVEGAGEKVVLAAGTYDVTNEFSRTTDLSGNDCVALLDRALAVEGAGREETVLDLGRRPGFILTHADACVRSLTLRGGRRTDVQWNGAALRILSGCASNVVVRDGGTYGSTVYVGTNARFADALVTNMTHCGNVYYPIVSAGGILEDVRIVDCLGGGCGGIYLNSPSVSAATRLKRVRITKCGSVWSGTTALAANFACTMEDCDFSDNNTGRATGGGTVLIANGGSPNSPDLRMANCRFVGNIVSGGPVINIGSWAPFRATNVLVAANQCTRGVIVDGWAFNVELVNFTVTDNTSATYRNAGVYAVLPDSSQSQYVKTLKNCVCWNNHGIDGEGSSDCELAMNGSLKPTVLNCCWPEVDDVSYPTVNCTSADPQLRTRGDRAYYPRMAGSCFNAGTNEAWMATAKDLDGNDRIRYDRVDIGCFESPHDPGLMLLVK